MEVVRALLREAGCAWSGGMMHFCTSAQFDGKVYGGHSHRLASGLFRPKPRWAYGLQLVLSCVRSARRGRDEPGGEELVVSPLSAPSAICSAFGFYSQWLCRLRDPYCRRCSYSRDLQLSRSPPPSLVLTNTGSVSRPGLVRFRCPTDRAHWRLALQAGGRFGRGLPAGKATHTSI